MPSALAAGLPRGYIVSTNPWCPDMIDLPPPDPQILARAPEIVAGLADILGPENVIAAEDERRAYETDALTAYRAVPLAVVLPQSTDQVSKVLVFLNQNRVKVVARGA